MLESFNDSRFILLIVATVDPCCTPLVEDTLGVDLPKGGGVVPLEHVLPSPAELNPEEFPPPFMYILFGSFEDGDISSETQFPFTFRSSSMLKFKGFL